MNDISKPIATVCFRGDTYGHGLLTELHVQHDAGAEFPIGTKFYASPMTLPMDSGDMPTSYLTRFGDAMQLLCQGNRPPDKMLSDWLYTEDDALQAFAGDHGLSWAQGISLIEAARQMADAPTEDVAHEMFNENLVGATV